MSADREDLQEVFKVARHHGRVEGQSAEVEDVKRFAEACWATMNEAERRQAIEMYYAVTSAMRGSDWSPVDQTR